MKFTIRRNKVPGLKSWGYAAYIGDDIVEKDDYLDCLIFKLPAGCKIHYEFN